jgi:predicted dehydrogenase
MTKNKSRREFIKKVGLTTVALPIIGRTLQGKAINEIDTKSLSFRVNGNKDITEPITAITLGAGARGNVYGNYGVKFPNELKIVGVAEPIPIRNDRYAKKHSIPDKNRFVTWEHVFEQPKFADAIIITTPDHLHYGSCMQALDMGYDILLEKPISPTEQECRNILEKVNKTGRIVAVCHVLRYAPYFIKLRDMIRSGKIGELISVQHMEPIQHIHMSHSYVRGNWHNSKECTPIILAKSCHDLDILRWLIDEPCKSIGAYGDLKWFKSMNAPKGSTARCTDGCPAEESCPYSALKIYHRDRTYTYVFDLPDDKSKHGDFILEKLKTTNYGRCVYKMENDQPDHYIASMQFNNNITANFSMEAFTSYHGRRTRIMGSMGDIVGDMEHFIHTDFLTNKSTKWDITVDDVENYQKSGHGGGDWSLAADWIRAVKEQNPGILTSTIDASIESHIMGFKAEESRLSGQIKEVHL